MTAGTETRRDDAELARLATDIQRRIGVRATRNEPLASLTTMRVGGLPVAGREPRAGGNGRALSYRIGSLTHAPPGWGTWAALGLPRADRGVITEGQGETRRWRQGHQPLGMPSAGSVFRNPGSGPS